MANCNPPKKNQAMTFYVTVDDMALNGAFAVNPTFSSGDWQVKIDTGSYANLGTLPVIEPSSSDTVKIVLTAAEMNGDQICIRGKDQDSPKLWADYFLCILTTA